jgi:hypothetical protein
MHQEQGHSDAQPTPTDKTPVAPAAQTAPLPLDPNLFRHVGGGGSTDAPNPHW